MRSLSLAALLVALAAPAAAQDTIGADQESRDQVPEPGAGGSAETVPGGVPLFQPDPGTGPIASDTDLTAQVRRGGLGQAQTAAFIGLDGQKIGAARLVGTPHGLLIGLEVAGLPPSSWVAFHIHENGLCLPDSQFRSAGEHYTISDTDHGLLVPTGPHSGDMPNQWVGADGVLRSEVFNTFVQLADSGATVRGRALVIQAGRDDHESQPSGDAADRIACAVIAE